MSPIRRRIIRDYVIAALSLAAIYGVYVLVISPRREFPLGDDFAYAQTVRHLVNTGELRLSEWTSTSLIGQVYWGALFTHLLGGFSFTALRWSTLVISLVGCLSLYDLLRQLDLTAPAALFGALTLAVNPVFMYFSYTFMSDVFYISLMLLCLAFYARGVKHNAGWALLIGSLVASAAYLVRQLGVMLPLAAAAAVLLRDRKLHGKRVLLIGAVPALVFIGHTLWLRYVHGLPWGMELNTLARTQSYLRDPTFLLQTVLRLPVVVLYLGAFTLPVLLAQCASLSADRARPIRLAKLCGIWFAVLAILLAAVTVLTGSPLTYFGELIVRLGTGWIRLPGQPIPIVPTWALHAMTIMALMVGAMPGALWTDALFLARRQQPPAVTLLLSSLLMMALTAGLGLLYDRYVLAFAPATLYLGLKLWTIKPRGWVMGVTACVVFGVYGLVTVGDFFLWRTAFWSTAEQLVAQGVPPAAIDAGFEWIGWHEFETNLPRAIAEGKGNDLWGWLYVTPKPYRIAYEPLEGYVILERVPYRTPVLGRIGDIYVLQTR